VIDGLAPFEEDYATEITVGSPGEVPVTLRPVKPCTRCTVTEVDPATDEVLRSWVGPMPARCFSIPTDVISGHRLLRFVASP
jgi:hypothetical protein